MTLRRALKLSISKIWQVCRSKMWTPLKPTGPHGGHGRERHLSLHNVLIKGLWNHLITYEKSVFLIFLMYKTSKKMMKCFLVKNFASNISNFYDAFGTMEVIVTTGTLTWWGPCSLYPWIWCSRLWGLGSQTACEQCFCQLLTMVSIR